MPAPTKMSGSLLNMSRRRFQAFPSSSWAREETWPMTWAVSSAACSYATANRQRNLSKDAIAYGAEKVYVMESPLLKTYRTEPFARGAVALIQKYKPEIVLFGATTQGRDFAGNVATTIESRSDRRLHGTRY